MIISDYGIVATGGELEVIARSNRNNTANANPERATNKVGGKLAAIVVDEGDKSLITFKAQNANHLYSNEGHGIVTLENAQGEINLIESKANGITVGGHGILAGGNVEINLNSSSLSNMITSNGTLDPEGKSYGDAIHVAASNLGAINLTSETYNALSASSLNGHGIYTEKDSLGEINLTSTGENFFNTLGAGKHAISHQGSQTINLNAHFNYLRGGLEISPSSPATLRFDGVGDALNLNGMGKLNLDAQANLLLGSDNGIYLENTAPSQGELKIIAQGQDISYLDNLHLSLYTDLENTETKIANYILGGQNGIYFTGESSNFKALIEAQNGDNFIAGGEHLVNEEDALNGFGVYNQSANLTIRALNGNNYLTGDKEALFVDSDGKVTLEALGDNSFNLLQTQDAQGFAATLAGNSETLINSAYDNYFDGKQGSIRVLDNAQGTIKAQNSNYFGYQGLNTNEVYSSFGILSEGGELVVEALNSNFLEGTEHGLKLSGGSVTLNATNQNFISGLKSAIEATNGSKLTLDSSLNIIQEGSISQNLGESLSYEEGSHQGVAINAHDSQIRVNGIANWVSGAIEAHNSKVEFTGGYSNQVYSSYTGAWGDNVFVAVSAKGEGSEVTFNSEYGLNEFFTKIDYSKETLQNSLDSIKERTLWVSEGGTLTINGRTAIESSFGQDRDLYDLSASGKGAAIVAGSGNDNGSKKSTFNLNYGLGSTIIGDVVALKGGVININPLSEIQLLNTNSNNNLGSDSLILKGDILAGNGGEAYIKFTDGSYFVGRVDDFHDAFDKTEEGHAGQWNHTSYFNPQFDLPITTKGHIELDLGTNSIWEVTGQSWVTKLSGNQSLIDLTKGQNGNYALHVGELQGEHTFRMNLDGEGTGNILYIAKGSDAIQHLEIANPKEVVKALSQGTWVRFATISDNVSTFETDLSGINSELAAGQGKRGRMLKSFGTKYTFPDLGVRDYEATIAYRSTSSTKEEDPFNNQAYNTAFNGGDGSELKPGDENIQENYVLGPSSANVYLATSGTPSVIEPENGPANGNESSTTEDNGNQNIAQERPSYEQNNAVNQGSQNQMSDAAFTILDLSRANYTSAVYMDTLNKRLGEARFVGDQDHGMWARVRHDAIGKEDSFRSRHTMAELGFDRLDKSENGFSMTGVAFDYMNGSLDYDNVKGDGDLERYGLWLHHTYLGNEGNYYDLVFKIAHLDNDFEYHAKSSGEKITGDFDNNVISISGEVGYKFANEDLYFVEPQAQLQYAYVTSATYETSQETEVKLEGINSLIGRLGVRVGKDFASTTPWSLYLRADVLREFLGEQKVYASDFTGSIDETIENKDTWYSVGLGISFKGSENLNFFIEGEQVFGASYEDTYSISGGFRYAF